MVPGLNFDGATLRLTRHRPEGLQVVAWTLRGGTLWRWSSPAVTAMDALQEHWMRSYGYWAARPARWRCCTASASGSSITKSYNSYRRY